MKTNICFSILIFTLALSGTHLAVAEPFNDGGRGLDISPTKVVPTAPVRYNTVLYNARYNKAAQDKTPPESSFNDLTQAARINNFPPSTGDIEVDCPIVEKAGFNDMSTTSC